MNITISFVYFAFICCLDTDECASNPCQNGGACSDGVNKYNCVCQSGYEDANCQTGRSDCLARNAIRNDVMVLIEVYRMIITSFRH